MQHFLYGFQQSISFSFITFSEFHCQTLDCSARVLKVSAVNPFDKDDSDNKKIPIVVFDKPGGLFPDKCETHFGVPEGSETDAAIAKELGVVLEKRVLEGDVLRNSGEISNLGREEAREKIMEMAKKAGIGGHWKR